jgi:hypothetical protein
MSFDVTGFIEDGVFIADSFEPELDYNSLSDFEWAEIEHQFWLQHDPEPETDDST